MQATTARTILICSITLLAPSGCGDAPAEPDTLAVTHVSLLPMTEAQAPVLEDRTVLIVDGVITAIGATDEIDIPRDAIVVDGRGRYLLPGLIDMHVHFLDRAELAMFVAHGVTTVRNMGDFPEPEMDMSSWAAHTYYDSTLEVRARVESGDWIGPDMFLASPMLDGPVATLPGATVALASADDAEAAVHDAFARGYDFIKVYDNLPLESFERILEVAVTLGIPVVGHAPHSVPYAQILESGLHTNEHLTMFRDYEEIAPIMGSIGPQTADSGVWSCPTLVGLSHALPPDTAAFEAFFDEPQWQQLAPETKSFVREYLSTAFDVVFPGEHMETYFMPIMSALIEADAPIVAGTDAPVAALPGVGMHQELQWLVAAGMSPLGALSAATRDAATALGQEDRLGTVEVGKRADLVLLREDPLADISHSAAIDGVVLRGRWMPRGELDALLSSE